MTTGLTDQLNTYFSDLDAAQGPVTVDHVASIIDKVREITVEPATTRSATRVWIAAAAAAAVFIVLGSVSLLLATTRDGSPPASETPTATTVPEGAPTTAPGPVVTEPPVETVPTTSVAPVNPPVGLPDISTGWSQAPYDVGTVGGDVWGGMSGVTDGGFGLVAVGYTCSDLACGAGSDASVWVSADSLTWQQTPGGENQFGDGVFGFTDVAASQSGVIAVTECSGDGNLAALCDPGMWYSPDGIIWDAVEISAEVFRGCSSSGSPRNCVTYWNTVVASGSGFVAAGRDLRGPGIWASANGQEWTRVADPDMFPEGRFEIWDLAVAGPRIIAIGQLDADIFDDSGEWVSYTTGTHVWTSLDGINWEPVSDPDGVITSGMIHNPIVWQSRLVAPGWVCLEGEACPAVWTSPDGLTWSHTPLPDAAGVNINGAIANEEVGLMIWGESNTVGYFWTSVDGTAWERHTADPDMFGSGLPISDFIWYKDVLVGVGTSVQDGTPTIYRWKP